MSRADRLEAYGTGIHAAVRHRADGTPLVSPYNARSRRGYYWRRGMRRTLDALDAVMKAAP